MEVDEETPRSQAVVKNSSKTTRTKGSQGQDPQKAKESGKEIQASARRYRLTIDTEADDDSAAPQADVSSKPSGTNAATGANIWAALRAWEAGCYVDAKEFSQARLENTYTSLQAVLETQRNGLSAKNFNKTMHELYKKVTQSNSSKAALGSANSVI
ncbi:hypothetical protein MSAN_01498000 [Mycena sanguinolenta]|uniref:Uncharacterized protein n=1 Tax=Mycena sanguinolenta TaxID=230812 RepID=A0A8H6Y783_9AGAR|nr:hypothetical protein MSAN_01498000 [Mycena sanguinolenta]